MENMENTVDMQQQGSAPDDAAQAQAESLSSIVGQQPEGQQAQPEATAAKKEPGWIRQRVDAAVAKAVAETEARMNAHYEKVLAPIRESVLEREAQDLVSSGEFKSLERAKEYVRLKSGAQSPSAQTEAPQQNQTRDAQGRFAKGEPKAEDGDPVIRARADLLARQAQKIREHHGLDVMRAFNDDPEVHRRILSGEWDFYDVAESLSAQRAVPDPMRSPNGGGMGGGVSIANMSAEQFARLQQNLAAGRVYDMRK